MVTIVSGQKHVRLCPDTFVPRHVCAQTHIWYPERLTCFNKITKYSRRNDAGDCRTLVHTSLRQQQLSMLVFSPIKLMHFNLVNTIIILLLTKDIIVSDHNNSCWGTNMPGHRRVWAQSCLGTIMSGHKCVWAQSCLGTIMSGHSRVWAQSCLGTVVSGHSRVWAQS